MNCDGPGERAQLVHAAGEESGEDADEYVTGTGCPQPRRGVVEDPALVLGDDGGSTADGYSAAERVGEQ